MHLQLYVWLVPTGGNFALWRSSFLRYRSDIFRMVAATVQRFVLNFPDFFCKEREIKRILLFVGRLIFTVEQKDFVNREGSTFHKLVGGALFMLSCDWLHKIRQGFVEK